MGHWTKQVLSLWLMEAQRVSLRSAVFYRTTSRRDKIASNACLKMAFQKNVTRSITIRGTFYTILRSHFSEAQSRS